MADSQCVLVAEAIKDALATEVHASDSTFSLQFQPHRKWVSALDRARAGELQVTCIASEEASELSQRNATRHTYTVVIDVRRSIDPQQPEDVDLVAKLVQEICDFLRKQKMASADWVSAQAAFVYDPQQLYESHMFVAQVEAVYTMTRTIA